MSIKLGETWGRPISPFTPRAWTLAACLNKLSTCAVIAMRWLI